MIPATANPTNSMPLKKAVLGVAVWRVLFSASAEYIFAPETVPATERLNFDGGRDDV
jgi:hypothetical protein